MKIISEPFTLWTVLLFTFGIGGLTVLTWLSFETEKIDEETGRVIRDTNNAEAAESSESADS
jgi:hypothetical protein